MRDLHERLIAAEPLPCSPSQFSWPGAPRRRRCRAGARARLAGGLDDFGARWAASEWARNRPTTVPSRDGAGGLLLPGTRLPASSPGRPRPGGRMLDAARELGRCWRGELDRARRIKDRVGKTTLSRLGQGRLPVPLTQPGLCRGCAGRRTARAPPRSGRQPEDC